MPQPEPLPPQPLDLDRVLVTGGEGMIARAIPFGIKLSRRDLDVRDAAAVLAVVRDRQPSAITHLAALDIRQAEVDPKAAMATNVLGSYNLARAARAAGIPLVFLSSGAVFNGKPGDIHDETARPDPVNVFGQTKMLAELMLQETLDDVLIVRTGWVFGGHQAHHRKFVDLAIELSLRGEPIEASSDRWGSPTLVHDLVRELQRLVETRSRGLVHVVNQGAATGADLAREIVQFLHSASEVRAVHGSELRDGSPPRPPSEVLTSRTITLRPWPEALRAYLKRHRITRENHPTRQPGTGSRGSGTGLAGEIQTEPSSSKEKTTHGEVGGALRSTFLPPAGDGRSTRAEKEPNSLREP